MSIDSEKDISVEEKSQEIIEDEESSMMIEEEENSSQEENYIQKNSRIAKANKDIEAMENNDKNTGVIYVGHLPWGFDEIGVKKYFSQFGTITRIMLPRSQKTGRSKGYGFIEFDDMEVAEIAARTMNHYILFDRLLICNVVSDTSKYNLLFKKCKNIFKFHNKYNAYIFERNKPKSKHEMKDYVMNLLEKENKKREKIKDMGLDYDFPGFSALLNLNEKKSSKGKNSTEKNSKKNSNENMNVKVVEKSSSKSKEKVKEVPKKKMSIDSSDSKSKSKSKNKKK